MPKSSTQPVSGPALYMLTLAALAVAAVITGGGVARAALPGLVCVSATVKGVGKDPQRTYAQKRALIDWVQKVTAANGASYASWNRAAQRSINCTYHPQDGRHRWHCSAYGRPCRVFHGGYQQHRPARPAQPRLHRRP